MNHELDINTKMYILKHELDLSMIEYSEHVKTSYENYSVNDVSKKYIYLCPDKATPVETTFSAYMNDKIQNNKDLSELFKGIDESEIIDTLCENIDIFIDITEKDDDILILELNS